MTAPTRTAEEQQRLDRRARVAAAERRAADATSARMQALAQIARLELAGAPLPSTAADIRELHKRADLADLEEQAARAEADAVRAEQEELDASKAARADAVLAEIEAERRLVLEAKRAELAEKTAELDKILAGQGPVIRDAAKAIGALFDVHLRAQALDAKYDNARADLRSACDALGQPMPPTEPTLLGRIQMCAAANAGIREKCAAAQIHWATAEKLLAAWFDLTSWRA